MRRGTSLYLSAEDDETETHLRLREISEADDFELTAATDLNIALLAGQDAVLAAENVKTGRLSWTAVHQRLKATLEATRPVLLILDNLADMFAGNENVRSSARQFVGILRGIAMEYDCAVVLLAHPSLSGMSSGTGTSGNTAWSNSVRSRLYLRRDIAEDGRTEQNPNQRILETKKANYGPVGGSIVKRVWTPRLMQADFSEFGHMVRCCRVFGLMTRPFTCRGPLWTYADWVQIGVSRLMRSV